MLSLQSYFFFSSSLLDQSSSVFESSAAGADEEATIFAASDQVGRATRLPGRLSSSSLGGRLEPIRSVSSVFPCPEYTS